MPKPFKLFSTRPLPPDADILEHEGKPHVRLKDRGRPILCPVTKDGAKYLAVEVLVLQVPRRRRQRAEEEGVHGPKGDGELTADELRRLFGAARGSARTHRGLAGADRYVLYLVAAGTLTPADFDLDAPTVTLAARFAKNRKTKVQPLPADVAGALRDYLAGKPADSPVWGGTWAKDRRGATMLRIGLDAASIPYAVDGPDGRAGVH